MRAKEISLRVSRSGVDRAEVSAKMSRGKGDQSVRRR